MLRIFSAKILADYFSNSNKFWAFQSESWGVKIPVTDWHIKFIGFGSINFTKTAITFFIPTTTVNFCRY